MDGLTLGTGPKVDGTRIPYGVKVGDLAELAQIEEERWQQSHTPIFHSPLTQTASRPCFFLLFKPRDSSPTSSVALSLLSALPEQSARAKPEPGYALYVNGANKINATD